MHLLFKELMRKRDLEVDMHGFMEKTCRNETPMSACCKFGDNYARYVEVLLTNKDPGLELGMEYRLRDLVRKNSIEIFKLLIADKRFDFTVKIDRNSILEYLTEEKKLDFIQALTTCENFNAHKNEHNQ